jgi:hypothetical protein
LQVKLTERVPESCQALMAKGLPRDPQGPRAVILVAVGLRSLPPEAYLEL